MKYIKTYENINKPEIGDFVIVNTNNVAPYWKDMVNNGISELKHIGKYEPIYTATYFTETPPWDCHTFTFYSDELIAFSKNKEELEKILIAKNYNL